MAQFKKYLHAFRQSALITIALMILCGLAFPLLMTGIGALIFPEQAGGSLIMVNGEPVGSEHVGQEFKAPYFMKGRPSAVHYNTYLEDADGNKKYLDGSEFGGLASGSQNLAPSNPKLVERVKGDMNSFMASNPGIKKEDIPADLMTASGSGLDPHISPASAAVQIPGIVRNSGLSEETVRAIVRDNTEGRLLGIFGEETVNVLGVNIDIARKMGLIK